MKQRRLKTKQTHPGSNSFRAPTRPSASFNFQKRLPRTKKTLHSVSFHNTSFTSCFSGNLETAWGRTLDREPARRPSKNGIHDRFRNAIQTEGTIGQVSEFDKNLAHLERRGGAVTSRPLASSRLTASLRPQTLKDQHPKAMAQKPTHTQPDCLKLTIDHVDHNGLHLNPKHSDSRTIQNIAPSHSSVSHSHASMTTAQSLSHSRQLRANNSKCNRRSTKSQRPISGPKHTTFLSNIGSTADSDMYLTMEDLDQKSVRDFRRVAHLVAALLFFDMLFLVLGFAVEGRHLLHETTTCKLGSLGLTYIVFFIDVGYLLATFNNLGQFGSPRDFRKLTLVSSRRQLLLVFQIVFAVCLLQMHLPNSVCTRTSLFFDSFALLTVFLHSIVFYANFRQCEHAAKTCSFSEAVQSEIAESVAASVSHMDDINKPQNGDLASAKEVFEGSFCLYPQPRAPKRRTKRSRRRRRRVRAQRPKVMNEQCWEEDSGCKDDISGQNSVEQNDTNNDENIENTQNDQIKNNDSGNTLKHDLRSENGPQASNDSQKDQCSQQKMLEEGNVQNSNLTNGDKPDSSKSIKRNAENQQNRSGALQNFTPDSYLKLSSPTLAFNLSKHMTHLAPEQANISPQSNSPNDDQNKNKIENNKIKAHQTVNPKSLKTSPKFHPYKRDTKPQISNGIRVSFDKGSFAVMDLSQSIEYRETEIGSDLEDSGLEDLCLSVDDDFDMEGLGAGSVFETPTKRLEDEFRKTCMSAGQGVKGRE